MTWISKLLGKPADPPTVPSRDSPSSPPRRTGPAPVARPAVDPAALRLALAAAATDDERGRRADELGRALATQSQAPLATDPPEVWVAATCHAGDAAQALDWSARISGDARLGTVATQARFADVRLAAARRIDDTAVLEAVAQATREKDRGVYKHCSELLRQRRQAEERALRLARLAAGLRALLDTAPLTVSQVLELEHALDALGADASQRTDCDALLAQLTARLAQESDLRRAFQAHQAEVATLHADSAAVAWPDADQLAAWQQRLAAAREAQARLPSWIGQHAPAPALAALLDATAARLAALAVEHDRAAACEQLLAARAAAAATPPAAAAAVPVASPAAAATASVADGAPAAPNESAPAAAVVPGAEPAPQPVAGLGSEATAAAGAEAPAGPVAANAEVPGGPVADGTEAALAPVAPTVFAPPAPPAPVDWAAAWGALPKPEHAATRQALEARWQALQAPPAAMPTPPAAPSPPVPAHPALDRHALRRQLEQLERHLDQGHLANAEASARKLKTVIGAATLDAAHEARLQRALGRLGELHGWAKWSADQTREQLVATALALQADSQAGARTVDELAAEVPKLRAQWKQLNVHGGPAPQELWERFDAALRAANQPVAARRAEEAARHAAARAALEGLFAEWEAGLAAVDWEHADYPAIEARRQDIVKQWASAPPAGLRDQRALRKRYDTLLAGFDTRLDAARTIERTRREELVAAALALQEAPDIGRAIAAAKSLQERWRPPPGAPRLKRGDEQRLWQRFRAACDAVFARRDAQRAEQAAARAAEAARRDERSQACRAVLDGFAAALAGDSADAIRRAVAQFRTDWEAAAAGIADEGLQRRARELQQQAAQRLEALRQQQRRARFDQMAAAAAPRDGLDEEQLAEGHARRQELLLDMEIALGLPSPDDCAEARRRRQLQRLQSRFSSGQGPSTNVEPLLVDWYAVAAAPDPTLDARIATVVNKLLDDSAPPRRR